MAELVHSIVRKNSYHPLSSTHITSIPPIANRSLYLYFSLPPLIFVDPYELVHYESSYTFRHWGTFNLELPVHAITQKPSGLLLKVHHDDYSHELRVELPLHLRYGDLSKASEALDHHSTQLYPPTGFLEYPISDLVPNSEPSSGISRLPTEVTSLFNSQAHLIEIPTSDTSSPELLRVPIGSLNDLVYVELGTLTVIWMAVFYLLKASQSTYTRIRHTSVNKLD